LEPSLVLDLDGDPVRTDAPQGNGAADGNVFQADVIEGVVPHRRTFGSGRLSFDLISRVFQRKDLDGFIFAAEP
jgi:hypothetical protein